MLFDKLMQTYIVKSQKINVVYCLFSTIYLNFI